MLTRNCNDIMSRSRTKPDRRLRISLLAISLVLLMLIVPNVSAVIDGGYTWNQSQVTVDESVATINTAATGSGGACTGALRYFHGPYGGTFDLFFTGGSTPETVVNPWGNTSPSAYNHIYAASWCTAITPGWWEFKRWTILSGAMPPNATVNFVVTSTAGYTTKVSGALITIPNWGNSTTTTDTNGNATLKLIPADIGYSYTITAAGYTPIPSTALGAYGLNGGTVYVQMAPTSASPMYFEVRDWKTKVALGTINVNIQNISSGEWRNVTNTPGDFAVADTGASHQYPTVTGQSVGIGVSALGYLNPNDQSKTELFQYIAIQNGTAPPNNPYYIDLLANNDKIYNGTWNLDIALTDCDSHAALNGATVNLITGLNGWCTGPLGCFPNNIVAGGHYVFTNVTASLVASYTMGKPGYQSKTDTIQLVYPTNYSTSKAYCLLQIGSTSTATPTPTFTGNGTQVVTTGPTTAGGYPTITGSASDKATAAFNVFVDAAYAIATIVVGIIFIWLLWMTVYIITGGKIIDKIMKRGRR
jgi:hypothetical protein